MKDIFVVTGASGHLGNTLVNELVKNNKSVRAFILQSDKVVFNLSKEDIYYGDVTKKETLKEVFKTKKDEELIVIHCAGIVSIASKYSRLVYNVNVNGTKNIVDMCKASNVKKLIYISSVHAIPELEKGNIIKEVSEFNSDDVIGLYAKTKSEATKYVLDASKEGLNVNIIHPSGIVGPNDYGRGHITQLVIDYCNGSLTAGIKGGYDFVDVRDVVNGIMSCIEKGKNKECYILSNKYYSIKELFEMMSKVTGKPKVKLYLAKWFINLFVNLAELYYKIIKQPPLFTKYSLYTLNSNSLFSHEKATKELGYNPRDMRETIKDTIVWLENKDRIKKRVLKK